jgi:hypothetical protein
MERVYIDTLSFTNKDEWGNEHVLVIIDGFTRWIEIVPIPNLSAEVAARVLLNHFGRFGIPSQLTSDNGTQFVNELHEQMFRVSGIEFLNIVPHSKEENAIVERANKEIIRHMRNIMFDREIVEKWSLACPFVQRIMNSERKQSTGASPAELLFGNSITLDRNIFAMSTQSQKGVTPKNVGEWVAQHLDLQRAVIEAAQRSQKERDAKAMETADKGPPTQFAIDSLVLCEYPNQQIRRGAPNKLHPVLKGPMKVIERHGDEYVCEDLITHSRERVHVSRLRTFSNESNLDPTRVAMRDRGEFIVESVLEHSGNTRFKTQVKFRVRWQGYGPSDDTWLPFKELRANVKLHDYLRNNNLTKLIPKEFR